MKKKIHSCLVVLALFGLLAIALLPVHIYSTAPVEAAVLNSENPKQLTSAGDYSPGDVTEDSFIYLPIILRPCPDFFDDFSNPGSGWAVGEDDFLLAEYLSGEYRTLVKQAGWGFYLNTPTCSRTNYVVEVDARWVGTPGGSYGLIFGFKGDSDPFYAFEVNTDFQEYAIFKYSPGDVSLISPILSSTAIQSGNASNHLKVTRAESAISLEANGSYLGTWYDSTISGETGTGVVVFTYLDLANADARFDNYRVVSTVSADMLAPAQDVSAGMPQSTEVSAFKVQPYRVPARWQHGERQKP